MTTIDHRAFPSIIDTILAHADVRALMAIRATSRAFKQRVDAHLFRRAVFHSSNVSALTTPAGTRLPFAPSGVRVLDILAPLSASSSGHLSAFISLEVLRRSGIAPTDRRCSAFSPSTVVDIYNVPAGSQQRWPYIHIPTSTKRYVLHVLWIGRRPEASPDFMGDGGLREVVLVVGRDSLTLLEPIPPSHLVTELACRFLRVLSSGGTITLVGMGSPEAVITTARTRLMRSSTAQPKAVVAAMARFRCLSHGEWLAELGDRAEIEGGATLLRPG